MLGIVVGACSGSTNQGAPTAGSAGSGSSSLGVPLPPWDPEAFREAEANLRRDGRAQGGLEKLGPGAVELAALMDRTASFSLTQLPAKLKAFAPPDGSLTFARSTGPGSAGRLVAPLRDLPPPGTASFGTYIMTTLLFDQLIGDLGTAPPGSLTTDLAPSTDAVTVAGNKGTITTTVTVSATKSASKVSLLIQMKVNGEVRDAATGAVLFKIASEATGVATGDVCPDTSGVARAQFTFRGHEDYFNATGERTGGFPSQDLTGDLRMRADDNAKLAGVDLTASGGVIGDVMMRMAANNTAPLFEKAWRSGTCIAVLVDPEGGEVDKDSVTTVTAKVRHKIEGTELDKPVEAKLSDGVKSIEPAESKQKAPATFRFTAGPESGDKGGVSFDSVSNRGIGHTFAGFVVAGGWTISSVGTSDERFPPVISNTLKVTIKDLKVKAGKDNALSGSGTITVSGSVAASAGPLGECRGDLDQTIPVTASGVLVGTGKDAVLRLTLNTAAPADAGTTLFRCPGGASAPIQNQGYSDRYGETLGQFDLPTAAGTTTISRTAAIGGVMNVAATGTFTVVRSKP